MKSLFSKNLYRAVFEYRRLMQRPASIFWILKALPGLENKILLLSSNAETAGSISTFFYDEDFSKKGVQIPRTSMVTTFGIAPIALLVGSVGYSFRTIG